MPRSNPSLTARRPGARLGAGLAAGAALLTAGGVAGAALLGGGDGSEEPEASARVARAGARAANVWVDPDGGTCRRVSAASPYLDRAACASLETAHAAALPGDTVRVRPGSYGAQWLPGGSKRLVVIGDGGRPRLGQTTVNASDVVLRGLAIEGRDPVSGTGALNVSGSRQTYEDVVVDALDSSLNGVSGAGSKIAFRRSRIGNVTDMKGVEVSGRDVSFDRVLFHDVELTDERLHNECVYAIGVPGFSVRNSRFRNCATMDLFFTYGGWWKPRPPAYGGVTLENNVFGHARRLHGRGWHHYSLSVAATGPETSPGTMAPLRRWTVRNNSFETTVNVAASSAVGSRWVGNVGAWSCVPGLVYRYNVGTSCGGAGDLAVAPPASSEGAFAPFGWADPARDDFRLTPGSAAVDRGDPSDHPGRDIDGAPRPIGAAPDAGAHELRR